MQMNEIIKRHNGHSTADHLTLADLERLLTGVYGSSSAMISSPPLNPMEPEQVHLSYTHDPATEMFISFVTRQRPPTNLRPVIEYTDEHLLAIGDTTTYDVHDWHYFIHFIHVRGLEPGGKYRYRLGFVESDNTTVRHLFSNEHWSFTTMSGEKNRRREIVDIYGDMGTILPLGFEVMKSMLKDFEEKKDEQADYIVHVGDIAYAGTGAEKEVQSLWDLFMNQISPLASRIPYMTATGNHEKYFNYTSYRTRFFMPSKSQPTSLETQGNFFFSLQTNLVLWIFMSTEHNYTAGSPQRAFLEDILERFAQKWQGKERPWLIVVGHRPMYSSDQATDSGRLQEEIEPLLVKYGVDLAVWGHMHCYERTTPVQFNQFTDREHFSADGKIYEHNATHFNQTSPIHLTIGTAGALIREQWTPRPPWSQVRYQKYGFGKLLIHNRTQLQFQSVLLDDTSSDLPDSLIIIRHFQ